MRTTIDIDEHLLREAMRLSGLPTKKAKVEAGLWLLIEVHMQMGIRQEATCAWIESTMISPGQPKPGRARAPLVPQSTARECGFSH
jgi:hypothetical protein